MVCLANGGCRKRRGPRDVLAAASRRPIGLERRTTASGSSDRSNLQTLQTAQQGYHSQSSKSGAPCSCKLIEWGPHHQCPRAEVANLSLRRSQNLPMYIAKEPQRTCDGETPVINAQGCDVLAETWSGSPSGNGVDDRGVTDYGTPSETRTVGDTFCGPVNIHSLRTSGAESPSRTEPSQTVWSASRAIHMDSAPNSRWAVNGIGNVPSTETSTRPVCDCGDPSSGLPLERRANISSVPGIVMDVMSRAAWRASGMDGIWTSGEASSEGAELLHSKARDTKLKPETPGGYLLVPP
ncbi:hypothetical protein UY3_10475 [Chelonia mydas]|uniref:Uncharacterized protein n=1 Tax=Chelonia mydas TaxID=8469 RepID=M7BK54_CHEMY|nr:hypothetical protein UY3_10475 [Chelonia mydas]